MILLEGTDPVTYRRTSQALPYHAIGSVARARPDWLKRQLIAGDNGRTMMFPRDHLVAALHRRGICYLAPSPQGDEPELTDDELLIGLAASKDGRVRFALAGLLLVHPELAEKAACLIDQRCSPADGKTPPEWAWDELRKQYVAAMYLQRLWRTRLRLHVGDQPLIIERYTDVLNLPAADVMYGEMGLRVLTDRSSFNDWSSYEQVVEMICEQPCQTTVEN